MKFLLLAALLGATQAKICDPRELLKAYFESSKFYVECVPLKENNVTIGLGLWVRKECATGSLFVPVRQACVDEEQMRRESALCRIEKQLDFCDTTECEVLNMEDALVTCNWMEDPLRMDAKAPGKFYQCMPLEYGKACGRWVHQMCAEGTEFNADLQACLAIKEKGVCGENSFPGASCADDSECSSGVPCKQGVCCETVSEKITDPIPTGSNRTRRQGFGYSGLPICPSTGQQAVSTCSGGCPSNCGCHQGGCYPLATCQSGVLAGSVCGGSGSGCGSRQSCYMGSCCPQQQQQQQQIQIATSVAVTCPSGGQSQGPCSQGCASNCGCYNGQCCPRPTCPQGNMAQSFCGSSCGGQCYQGGCCQQQSQPQPFYIQQQVAFAVTCPTGVQSSTPCSNGCGSGTGCYKGACCPQATCPTGQVSSGFCGSSGCGAKSSCYQGCCCQQQQQQVQVIQQAVSIQVQCPSGQPSRGSCGQGCPSNCGCYQGQCCPYSQCPNGGQATSFCNGGCGGGQQCYQGCCCGQQQQQPYMTQPIQVSFSTAVTCPTGVQSNQPCGGGCGSNQGCYQGACCPMAQCPSGGRATGFCGNSGGCGGGQSCYQGCCCQQQQQQQQVVVVQQAIAITCPNGQQSNRQCSQGCGANQGCYQGRCCGYSQCPSGGQATSFCGSGNSCGGGQTCNQGCCCPQQQQQQQQMIILQQQFAVTCPNGQRSNQPCSQGCGSGQGCYQGGCCSYSQCPSGGQATGFCGSGNSCGGGQSCNQGCCCPQQQQQQQVVVVQQAFAITCPNGQQSNQPCSQGCGANQGCYQGGCCQYSQCPSGGQATGFCGSGNSCGGGQSCNQGCCCPQQQQQQQQVVVIQQAIAITCPNGQQSNRQCSQGCGANQGCYQGRCCGYSQCPSGGQATSFCGAGNSCGGGQSCNQGCCCPQRQQAQPVQIQFAVAVTCPTGVQSNQPCNSGCGGNQGCYQGACCPMAQCPSGGQASGFCGSSGACGGGQSCYQGCCCQQQQQQQVQPAIYIQQAIAVQCPNGGMSTGSCSQGCGANQGCYQGGCCSYSQCPSGGQATGFCGSGNSCGGGQTCNNGCCCQQQQQQAQPYYVQIQTAVAVTCPTGVQSTRSCGGGCGSNQGCYQGKCCPMAQCPSGGYATSFCGSTGSCGGGSSCVQGCCCQQAQQQVSACSGGVAPISAYGGGCPSGYATSSGGGCCPSNAVSQSFQGCGQGQAPMCGCSNNQRCPGSSTCSSGNVCCGAAAPVSTPGCSCGGNTCGANSQCVNGGCQCNRGTCSNGVSCVPSTPALLSYSPRPSCSSCGRRYKDVNRKPSEEFFPVINGTKRTCTKHCTCTPDEVCVDNQCLKRLSPGQMGCTHDQQCSHDCKSATCDMSSRTCKCAPGLYTFVDFGLCFKKCPIGTDIVEGKFCKPKLSLKILSRNRLTREQIESTQTCGPIAERDCNVD